MKTSTAKYFVQAFLLQSSTAEQKNVVLNSIHYKVGASLLPIQILNAVKDQLIEGVR